MMSCFFKIVFTLKNLGFTKVDEFQEGFENEKDIIENYYEDL
jgi:hypothetical protein